MPVMQALPGLMSIPEVARYLSVPEATLRYWRYQGTGPRSIKVGRHVRYQRSEVERYLRELQAGASRDGRA